MALSGTAPDNGADDDGVRLTTDGIFIYAADFNTTTVRKYSISGTTITFDSAITMPDNVTTSIYTNGTYFWFQTDPSGNTSDDTFYKTEMDGTEVYAKLLVETTANLSSLFFFEHAEYLHVFANGIVNNSSGEAKFILPLERLI